MKTATTQAGSCLELFYSGGADEAVRGETNTQEREGGLGGFRPITPLPCPQRMKTATTQAGSCFELFYSGGADKAEGGETKTPKPKSQTRGRKEVAVAEEGGGSETTTRKVKLAKL